MCEENKQLQDEELSDVSGGAETIIIEIQNANSEALVSVADCAKGTTASAKSPSSTNGVGSASSTPSFIF